MQTNSIDMEDSILESSIKPLIHGETGDGDCSSDNESDATVAERASSDAAVPALTVPTATQAAQIIETALKSFETQDINSVKIMQLQHLINIAKRAGKGVHKQSKVSDFFKKLI